MREIKEPHDDALITKPADVPANEAASILASEFDLNMNGEPRIPRITGVVVLVVALAMFTVQCSNNSESKEAAPGVTDSPSRAIVQESNLLAWDETTDGGGDDAILEGEITFDPPSACYTLRVLGTEESVGVIWPVGTTTGEDHRTVVLPDGTPVPEDSRVSGVGGFRASSTIVDLATPADAAQACRGASDQFAVFNPHDPIEVLEDSSAPET